MRIKFLIFLAVAVSLALAMPARADTAAVTDPEDTNDMMDLATASHAHGPRKNLLVHTIGTHGPWTNNEFLALTSSSGCPMAIALQIAPCS